MTCKDDRVMSFALYSLEANTAVDFQRSHINKINFLYQIND